jgi:hypothetical protein
MSLFDAHLKTFLDFHWLNFHQTPILQALTQQDKKLKDKQFMTLNTNHKVIKQFAKDVSEEDMFKFLRGQFIAIERPMEQPIVKAYRKLVCA